MKYIYYKVYLHIENLKLSYRDDSANCEQVRTLWSF